MFVSFTNIEEDVRFPAGLRCVCECLETRCCGASAMLAGMFPFDAVYDYRRGLRLYFLWAFYKIYYYLFKEIAVAVRSCIAIRN